MSKFKAIDDGLEALDIPGYGCLIRTEKGRPLQVLEGVTVGTTIVDPGDETKPPLLEYTLIFDDSISPAAAAAAKSLKPTQVASSLASVNVNAFLKHVEQRSLSPAGEFGNYGPPIAKLRDFLKGVDLESETASSLGNFLATGDHLRHGPVAAVVALSEQRLAELSSVLTTPEPEKIEAFVDACIVGTALTFA